MKNIKLLAMIGLLGLVAQMNASVGGFVENRAQMFGETVHQKRQKNNAAKTIQTGWRHHKQAQQLQGLSDWVLQRRAEAQAKVPMSPSDAMNEVLTQGGTVAAENVRKHVAAKARGLRGPKLTSDEQTYAAMLEGALNNAQLSKSEQLDVLGEMILQIKQHG